MQEIKLQATTDTCSKGTKSRDTVGMPREEAMSPGEHVTKFLQFP